MLISVCDETGERFSYDTDKASLCLCPGRQEAPQVIAALFEALQFLCLPPTLSIADDERVTPPPADERGVSKL